MGTHRVLVVDGDPQEARLFEQSLVTRGMSVIHAPDKRAGLQRFFTDRPDAIVIDAAAPGMPPFQLLERVRTLCEVPVLIIGPSPETDVAVQAFDAGADDFARRPIHPTELCARVRALVQRAKGAALDGVYIDRHLQLNFRTHEACNADGDRIDLTPLQFRLLTALVRNRGHVLTPDQLLDLAWGAGAYSPARVKVQVSNLRDRLSQCGIPKDVIETVTGVGYRYRSA